MSNSSLPTGQTYAGQEKKSRKRGVLFIAAGLLVAYAIVLTIIAGSGPPVSKPSRLNPMTAAPEIVGVYHLHSRFSDGRGEVNTVVAAARQNHLDFIILTDHGNPNYACLRSQGFRQGVLVLAGSELSTNRGHLVGIGFTEPKFAFPHKAEEAGRLIQNLGGMAVIAHPFSKISWTWGNDAEPFHGLELVDADTMLKKSWPLELALLPLLILKPRIFFLWMVKPFPPPYQQWDRLNRQQPLLYGFFSCDAHLLYKHLLSLFHLRIPYSGGLPSEFEGARKIVLDALCQGNFYNSLDAAQPASGFRFWAEKEGLTFSMGSRVPAEVNQPVFLCLRIPERWPTSTYLIRDGEPLLVSPEKEIRYRVREAGVYRVEVYLRDQRLPRQGVPWIVSNPIFLEAGKS